MASSRIVATSGRALVVAIARVAVGILLIAVASFAAAQAAASPAGPVTDIERGRFIEIGRDVAQRRPDHGR